MESMRAYIEIPQSLFKEKMKDLMPSDACIYAFEVEPRTSAIRIYFYSQSAPELPEGVSAAFYYSETLKKGRSR